MTETTDLVSILRISDDPLPNAAADRIEALEEALQMMLEAVAMGPLEIAAKYGPDAHPDEALVDASFKSRAILAARADLKRHAPYPFCLHPEKCIPTRRCMSEPVCND